MLKKLFTIEKLLESGDKLHLLKTASHCEVVVLGAEGLHNVHVDLTHSLVLLKSDLRTEGPPQYSQRFSATASK